ncbi:hypothetical protein OV320_1946 [Actinobacteria bacterium OV320]|nr:hypothetical protein OV320_1946 [Actinobacteria bacterium OV320]
MRADRTLRATVVTAVPGRPLHGIAHPSEPQQLLFHQIGALAGAIHRSAAPLPAEEGVPAFVKVERHLEAARPTCNRETRSSSARSRRMRKMFRMTLKP